MRCGGTIAPYDVNGQSRNWHDEAGSLRVRIATAALLDCGARCCAGAGRLPEPAIRIVVPSAPSAGLMFCRILARVPKWGQPFIVENRPGGSNNIAAQRWRARRPTDTPLTHAAGPLVTHQHLFAKLG